MAAKKSRIVLPMVEPPNCISNNSGQPITDESNNMDSSSFIYIFIRICLSVCITIHTQKNRPLERKWWEGEEGREKMHNTIPKSQP